MHLSGMTEYTRGNELMSLGVRFRSCFGWRVLYTLIIRANREIMHPDASRKIMRQSEVLRVW